jgi:hypothetical protein
VIDFILCLICQLTQQDGVFNKDHISSDIYNLYIYKTYIYIYIFSFVPACPRIY